MPRLKITCGLLLVAFPLLAEGDEAAAQTNATPEIQATEATNYLGREVVVRDRVVEVTPRSTVVLLNLNQRYPETPLTCVIRNKNTNRFPEVESYLGRRVEVSGRLIDYQGRPEFILTSTNQIKVLDDDAPGAKPLPAASAPQARASFPVPSATAPPLAAPPGAKPESTPEGAVWWIVGSLGIIILLLAVLVLLFWRRNPRHGLATHPGLALIPAQSDAAPAPASAEEWKQRALLAEAMASQHSQMIREKMMPELAEFAKQSLVQGLYAQRNTLIETQQKAQRALAELEARLASLQLPLQERIRAYERRVAELEKEVAAQNEGMCELTRATLELVRSKLADERRREHVERPLNRG